MSSGSSENRPGIAFAVAQIHPRNVLNVSSPNPAMPSILGTANVRNCWDVVRHSSDSGIRKVIVQEMSLIVSRAYGIRGTDSGWLTIRGIAAKRSERIVGLNSD